MPGIKELREKRFTVAQKIAEYRDKYEAGKKAANDPNYTWDAETEKTWQQINDDFRSVEKEIAEYRSTQQSVEESYNAAREIIDNENRHRHNPNPKPGREDTFDKRDTSRDPAVRAALKEERSALALSAWACGAPVDQRMAKACKALRFNPRAREIELGVPTTAQFRALQREYQSHNQENAFAKTQESRAMSAIVGTSGGVLNPDSLLRTLEVNMLFYGGIRQAAATILTERGEELTWPTVDDTTNEGQQTGENQSVDGSTEPTFGGQKWYAYKLDSKMIKVPWELTEDSVFDLPSLLGEFMGERLGRYTNGLYTVDGTGAGEALALLSSTSAGKTTSGATAITFDEILDLMGSVDRAYRDKPGAGFMFHDNILTYLRKLKDGQGQPLWQMNVREDAPNTIYAKPYIINNDMATTSSGAPVSGTKSMVFGHLPAFKIRRAGGTRVRRLEERYADTDQIAFITFIREDAKMLNAGTVPIKHLLQA